MPSPSLTDLSGHFIQRVSRLLLRRGEPRLKDLGLSAAQLPVLATLKDGVSLSQTALATLIRVEQPSMAQLLARMERDGLVERAPDPDDRRASVVRLTDKANALLPRARRVLVKSNTEALKGFSQAEVDTLNTLLRRIIVNLEDAD